MSLRTPSKDRRRPRLLCRGAKESYHRAEAACGWSLPVCPAVKPVGEPDALIGHVRFDERGWETERCRMAQATAPILDSTFSAVPTAPSNVGFSNRPFRVKRFQTIHHYSVDVAHRLVLLFGIGI